MVGGQLSVRAQAQNGQFCSGGAIAQADGGKPGQAAAHLLGVIEVEVLAHVHRAAVMLLARGAVAVPCVVEAVIVTAHPLERIGRGVVDLLVKQGGFVPGTVHGVGYSGMTGQAVRGSRRLLVPVTALRYEPCLESVKLSSE